MHALLLRKALSCLRSLALQFWKKEKCGGEGEASRVPFHHALALLFRPNTLASHRWKLLGPVPVFHPSPPPSQPPPCQVYIRQRGTPHFSVT
jgi:hypothetical protein